MSGDTLHVSHPRVWALAGPIILSNISVPLVGAVDTAVVGHLPGPEYIGAVALGALIFSFLYWGFSFLRMGTTGFTARALGAGDHPEVCRTLARMLVLALFFGLVVILLGRPVVQFALEIIDSSPRVEQLAVDYAYIRMFSAPATLCVYVSTGVMIGLQNTRQVFLLQIVLNVTNILLDLLFVPILNFGVTGVAWASLIAEYTAAILGCWLMRDHIFGAINLSDRSEIFSFKHYTALMRTNSHIFVRTLCLVFSFAFFTAQGAKLGEMILAANTILLQLQSIMAYGLDGFAHAAEALTGSAYGAKNESRFRDAVRITTKWAVALAACLSTIYFALGDQILGLFSNQHAILATAATYLPWMIVSPLVSVWSFQLDGIFIGVGHTRQMRNAMLVSTLGYLGLVWLLLPYLGNHGLFLALTLFMMLRAVTLWYYFPGIIRSISDTKDKHAIC